MVVLPLPCMPILLSTPKIPGHNQAPLFGWTSPCRYETGLELVTGGKCAEELAVPPGVNFRLLAPSRPLPAVQLSSCPAVVFCLRLGSFPPLGCGLGPGQSGMVNIELLGSAAGAVWKGQPWGRALSAVSSTPLAWQG